MSELNHAAQACKSWFAATANPSFHLLSAVPVYATLEKLRALIASPLRNHISNLTMTQRMTSISQLLSLHALQHLAELEVSIDLS